MITRSYECDVAGCGRKISIADQDVDRPSGWCVGHASIVGNGGYWADFWICPDHFAELRTRPELFGATVLRLMDEFHARASKERP